MSFDALRVAIATQFIANWTETTDYEVGENKDYDEPDGLPWARVTHVIYDTDNAAVGKDFQRSTGEIIVQCFVPINSGEQKLMAMVNNAVSVFQNQNFDGVDCFASRPVRIGIGPDKVWYQYNVATEFRFDVFS